jgi:hypothetical protein
MKAAIRSCLASVAALIAVSALVLTPAVPRDPLARTEKPAVALAALARPLLAPTTLTATRPLGLLGQQVNFHIDLLVDFIATGAQLAGRIVAIPGTFLQDIESGTARPDALGRALVDFAVVELDAGRELVGFARKYADFQIHFLANFLRDVIAFATALPIAVGEFFAGLTPPPLPGPSAPTPGPVTASVCQATPAETPVDASPRSTDVATASASDDRAVERVDASVGASSAVKVAVAEQPKRPSSVVAAARSAAAPTVRAQGEVRSGATNDATANDSAGTRG